MPRGDYNRLTQEQFLSRSVAIHGAGRYDYSQVEYRNNAVVVTIVCPTHGVFKQQPSNHLKGQGCPSCGRTKSSEARKKSLDDFCKLFKIHHNNYYDYSQSVYEGSKAKMKIICPVHGAFQQTPESHAEGKGCAKCGVKKGGRYNAVETPEFIARANKIHNFKYSYTKTNYIKGTIKVSIICPVHGLFLQRPGTHLLGHGCLECGKVQRDFNAGQHWIERAGNRATTLYMLRLFTDNEQFYKVGITVGSVASRYKAKDSLANYQYEILAQHTSTDASRIYEWEQSILETFAHLRYYPKGSFGGASECFSSADEILAIFPL